MTQMVLQHWSAAENRESIEALGLLPSHPVRDGNFRGYESLENQPFGVYALPLTHGGWWGKSNEDRWTFAYTGPMLGDPKLGHQTVVIKRRIAPEELTLADPVQR